MGLEQPPAPSGSNVRAPHGDLRPCGKATAEALRFEPLQSGLCLWTKARPGKGGERCRPGARGGTGV